jgi:hypothetical protein
MRFRCLAVGIGILAAASIWQARVGQGGGATTQSSQDTDDLIRHGEYLVNATTLCGDCPTPHQAEGGKEEISLARRRRRGLP